MSEQITRTDDGVERNGVRIVDTFAEAFGMRAARVIITAQTAGWARTAAESMTGFATSVIGCKVEAGIEGDVNPDATPDGRPGVSVLLFGFDADGLQRQLIASTVCPMRRSGSLSADNCVTSATSSSRARC
jgi:formylmethanofuran--tetrahydromethanopterin N-formyltransferase